MTTNSWIDSDSIQVETHGIIKTIAREYLQNNTYYSMVLLIYESSKKYCYESIECYNMTGKRLGAAMVNPKDESSWINYKDDNKLILEIIKFTPAFRR